MNPGLKSATDKGGNPFSIANALKPSKAPITLKVVTVDGRLTYHESEQLRSENAAYRAELAAVEALLAASAQRMAAMEARIGRLLAARLPQTAPSA